MLSSMALSNNGPGFHDGISLANGKSITVAASCVVSVHDGMAKIAKTDPKDTTIFAKTGGPFDKTL